MIVLRHRYSAIWLILAVFLAGCGAGKSDLQIESSRWKNPWTNLNLNNKPSNFQFVIVADRTGGHRQGVFADAIRKINLLEPEFVICVGDLIEGYSKSQAEIDSQWSEFENIIKELRMPFFYVPGNHDITNDVMLKKWKEHFGRPYYHFIYHNILFLCLDTEGGFNEYYPSRLSNEQIEYFRTVLVKNTGVRWTLIFLHNPLWESGNQSWLEFEKLLTDRNYTVFAGHEHQYAKNIRNGRRYIRLATTGAESPLNGPEVGTFDHIVWVTMSDEGPKLANLMLSGIYDENVTPYIIASAAKFLKEKIDNGEVVCCEPITADEDFFTAGRTHLKITNFAAVAMGLKGSFKNSPFISLTPQTIDETIPPSSTRAIDVKLKAIQPVKVNDLAKIDFDAVITYRFPNTKSPVQTMVHSSIAVRGQTK